MTHTHLVLMAATVICVIPAVTASAEPLPNPTGRPMRQQEVMWDVCAWYLTHDPESRCYRWQGPYPVATFMDLQEAERVAGAMRSGRFVVPLLLPRELKSPPLRLWPLVRRRFPGD